MSARAPVAARDRPARRTGSSGAVCGSRGRRGRNRGESGTFRRGSHRRGASPRTRPPPAVNSRQASDIGVEGARTDVVGKRALVAGFVAMLLVADALSPLVSQAAAQTPEGNRLQLSVAPDVAAAGESITIGGSG